MNFQFPEILYAIPLLLAAAFLYMARSRSSVDRRRFPFFIAGVVFVVFAVSNPYWRTVPAKEQVKGVDLILLMDVSQSMFSAVNRQTRRIDLARKFLKTLLPAFSGSQIGLIYFAGDAQIGSPFTPDSHAIGLLIDSISPGMSTQPGTRTESVQQALDQLLQTRGVRNMPLLLLFSDGEFFDSTRGFQNYVKGRGLRIMTYLCGDQKAPVLRYDLKSAVPEAFSTPNPESLKRVAEATKGTFFDLTKQRGNIVLEELNNRLKDLIIEGQSVPDYRPVPFMIAGLICFLLAQWLPVPSPSAAARPAVGLALLLFMLTNLSMKPEESLKLWKEAAKLSAQGKADAAMKTLNRIPSDFFPNEKAIFIGNLHYQQGNLDEAVRYYGQVVEREPFNATARWNWEVALKRRSNPADKPPQPQEKEAPQSTPEERNALLQYVDQLEKEQRQKSNQANFGKSEFAW